ncbi:MAG: hypothetical protein NC427_06110 [Ruminococcus flavefaciens]|nr:hypothetical protein [Ruminococcus flavefaciens]
MVLVRENKETVGRTANLFSAWLLTDACPNRKRETYTYDVLNCLAEKD